MIKKSETSEQRPINRLAFWSAFCLAPLSIGIPSYGLVLLAMAFEPLNLGPLVFLFFPGAAMFVGAPTYITFGAYFFWKALRRGYCSQRQLVVSGLLAHFASIPFASFFFFAIGEDVLGPTLGFFVLGCIFVPLWSAIFAALYKRMS